MRLPTLHLWNHHPDPVELEPVLRIGAGAAPEVRRGERLSLLCWNVQYAGTRRHRFFYDGGTAVRVPEADVREAMAEIARVIRAADADIVLLQELDRGSDRTGRVDQWARLQGELAGGGAGSGAGGGYLRAAGACYHRSRFVPVPWGDPLGRVDFWLGAMARREIRRARRIALSPLDESALRRRLNLKRAILEVELPIRGGGALRIGDTHLSAFSRGDGTLERQAGEVAAWAGEGGSGGEAEPVLIAGDFNLLPEGDDPARLGGEAGEYTGGPSPLRLLRAAGLVSAVPAAELLEARRRTYLPPGAAAPDRVLDYAFGRGVRFLGAEVLEIPAWLSDHRPLRVEFEV